MPSSGTSVGSGGGGTSVGSGGTSVGSGGTSVGGTGAGGSVAAPPHAVISIENTINPVITNHPNLFFEFIILLHYRTLSEHQKVLITYPENAMDTSFLDFFLCLISI
jgi:hypothetical protein